MKTQKNRGGRPPKSSEDRQEAYLDVRLKRSEKKAFQDAANFAGLPLAGWVRERLRQAAIRELEGAAIPIAFLADATQENNT